MHGISRFQRTFLRLAAFASLGFVAAAPAISAPRIIGGTDVPDGRYPFLVDIELRPTASDDWRHNCGGSLIAPDLVVTAAHCLPGSHGTPADAQIRLVFGRTDRSHPPEQVAEGDGLLAIVFHPEAGTGVPNRDAGLIVLRDPINNIQPARIANHSSFYRPGLTATVAGWGYTEDGVLPQRMREVDVALLQPEACRSLTSFSRPTSVVPPLCAGFGGSGGPGVSGGDSGSPLFLQIPRTNDVIQLGLVSGVSPVLPDGYTNLLDPQMWKGLLDAAALGKPTD
ncbi:MULTISPECIES: trypsin-like serine protease [unclassified Pseudoxanthomonas]|uniref:S1 family peptidase n=1 Tax=unclassified Pseudoxanthomonas TaxID=2645906 RepID=UPI003077EB16